MERAQALLSVQPVPHGTLVWWFVGGLVVSVVDALMLPASRRRACCKEEGLLL